MPLHFGSGAGQPTGINHLVDVAELAEDILAQPQIEGITISGGEPFLQAKALAELVRLLRSQRDLGVIVFTGYYLQELRELDDEYICDLLDCADLLIDGPLLDEKNDSSGLRGSANQTMCYLTDRYRDYYAALEYGTRKLEITRSQIIGIKPKDFDKSVQKAFAKLLNKKLIANR